MAKTTVEQQVDLVVKLLVVLLTEPSLPSHGIARTLGVGEDWVHRMMMRFRDADLNVEYDRGTKRYTIGKSEDLRKSILGPFSRELKKTLAATGHVPQPLTKAAANVERYDVKQFALYLGTSPQNIANMISEYKGQSLPDGWVAYQVSENGKWFIQKMEKNATGDKYRVPDSVKSVAFSYVVGADASMKVRGPKPATQKCLVGDGEPTLAKGVCSFHYYQLRRHPEYLAKWKREAKAKGK